MFPFTLVQPLVETCGLVCPDELPLEASATIMGYCDRCDGKVSLISLFAGVPIVTMFIFLLTIVLLLALQMSNIGEDSQNFHLSSLSWS